MSVGINDKVVGTCGNCGGAVVVPIAYMSVMLPTPTCKSCGATVKADHGPRLPMNPPVEHPARKGWVKPGTCWKHDGPVGRVEMSVTR